MPQTCQIIGVNSVTNIELDKGVLPAPIVRNADWFGKLSVCRISLPGLCLAWAACFMACQAGKNSSFLLCIG